MSERSRGGRNKSSKYTSKHRCLEHIKVYHSLRKGAIQNEFDQEQADHQPLLAKLKSLDLTVFYTGEW